MGLEVQSWRCVLFILTLLVNCSVSSNSLASNENPAESATWSANVNISYTDPQTSRKISDRGQMGTFASNSLRDSVTGIPCSRSGIVVHVRDKTNSTLGCTEPINRVPPKTKWIALIQRGKCSFHQKIYNSAVLRNAAAVVIYNNKSEEKQPVMDQNVENVVAIIISKEGGERIARLVDNGTTVMMNISAHEKMENDSLHEQFNKTSVLFVSISFIVLMVVSLAWLIFYYVQRFRYVHAKERLSRRLAGAAKKAISKIPVRTLKSGDKETQADAQQCAVCIENFVVGEVVRELPCKHLFHKSCVDPWLLDQRSCPMCKMDILKAYGLQVPGAPLKDGTDDHIEITSTQSPDEDSIDPTRSIHMVHVESGVLFHHRQESIGSPSNSSSLQLDATRRRNPSGESVASHESLKSNESSTELESLIHVKPPDQVDNSPDNSSRTQGVSSEV